MLATNYLFDIVPSVLRLRNPRPWKELSRRPLPRRLYFLRVLSPLRPHPKSLRAVDSSEPEAARSLPAAAGNPQFQTAFTLIELLVVIAIIAVLMGLAFPVFQGVQDRARKVQAKNDLMQIVTAVNAYYTDYGVYPLNSGNNGGGADTVYGDPNGAYSSADLFDVLRAVPDANYNSGNQLNTRQVVYFNGNNAKDPTNPRGGIATGAATINNSNGYPIKPGSYVDPWGDEYVVFIDADYSGDIMQSLGWFYTDFSGGTSNTLRVGVGASSLGKDGMWGSKGDRKFAGSDDVGSWD